MSVKRGLLDKVTPIEKISKIISRNQLMRQHIFFIVISCY